MIGTGGDAGHLTLTRRQGEAVHLDLPDGRRVTVEVGRVLNSEVRLRFVAARDIRIRRAELDQAREGDAA